ncbi:MAG: family 43 glycosylhydrolase [Clostridia bacterium]|nr:family 43 glycosylhydrolase [Clostridia bacterium]
MKKRNLLTCLTVFCLILVLSFTACGGPKPGPQDKPDENNNLGKTEYNPITYDNVANNAFINGEDAAIEGQWAGYGMGDPYILRYNGMYYLYVSSLDSEYGVRGWKSENLVHWVPCQGAGLAKGYVSQDAITAAAYAPEVYYWNGTFYMYTSPAGAGHYVLTAPTPEGPFTQATENFGHYIDGSVFIDDDESMYFLEAHGSGIRYAAMQDMLTVGNARAIGNTTIGSWTEGAYLLKRDGKYYLTYTGQHVASDGYKIAYSVSDEAVKGYSYGAEAMLALNTEGTMKGIGHSATVMGPDMDSYYLSYHILNSSGGPNRSYALDRLLFNGEQMTVSINETGSIAPAMPAFSANGTDALVNLAKGVYGTEQKHEANFTAEFNFKGEGVEVDVAYVDADNKIYVTVDYAAKEIVLMQKANGVDTEIARGTLVNSFDPNAMHTVRIAHRDGKMDVYFDNLCKIDNASVTAKAGAIAIANATEIGYVAFSNVAMGMSDQLEYKQADTMIGAVTYTPALSKLESSSVSFVEEECVYVGAGQMSLSKGEYATYLVNVKEDGFYGLEMVYPTEMGGTKIGVRLNGGDVYRVTLPAVQTADLYVRALVTEFDMEAGVNEVTLEAVEAFDYVSFGFVKTAKVNPLYEDSLENYVEKGADYQTLWKIRDGAHFVKANTRSLLYFGDNTLTDYTVTVEMKFNGSAGQASAGLILRADDYAASSHDDYTSIQGYYVYVKESVVGIERLNYFDSNTSFDLGVRETAVDTWFTLKVTVKQNTIMVYVNDELILNKADSLAFVSGRFGLYTNGASVYYRNLKIEPAA